MKNHTYTNNFGITEVPVHSLLPLLYLYFFTIVFIHKLSDNARVYDIISDITRVLRHHKSSLFVQQLVQANIKTSKLRITPLCEGKSPAAGGFPSQRAINVEIIYMSQCHHAWSCLSYTSCHLFATKPLHKQSMHYQIHGLVQERCSSSTLALELRLSCIKAIKIALSDDSWSSVKSELQIHIFSHQKIL